MSEYLPNPEPGNVVAPRTDRRTKFYAVTSGEDGPDSKGWMEFATLLETELTTATKALAEAEVKDLQRGNILGRIAIALFGDNNNVSDEDCLKGVSALRLTADKYERAHNSYRTNILELLQRCQNGEASCAFVASVIEAANTAQADRVAKLEEALNTVDSLLSDRTREECKAIAIIKEALAEPKTSGEN